VEAVLIDRATSLRDTMAVIDQSGTGIALVVDADHRLEGVVSDGDVRRAVLAGRSLDTTAGDLLDQPDRRHVRPHVALVGDGPAEILRRMQWAGVAQMPVIDGDGRVAHLALLRLLAGEALPRVNAVVMAGGFGSRLRPLTETVPKPMLPVGGKPLIEHIIASLKETGVGRVNVTTHYLPEQIRDYFGDGSAHGVNIDYVQEDRPLGTAGALSLLEPSDGTMLVVNGDIVTDLNFEAMINFHRRNNATLTVAIKQQEIQIAYGVVDLDGCAIRGIREKPRLSHFINAGIYLVEPAALTHIPKGRPYFMTDLIAALADAGETVVGFPICEYWLDIGRHDDYEKANHDVDDGKVRMRRRPPVAAGA